MKRGTPLRQREVKLRREEKQVEKKKSSMTPEREQLLRDLITRFPYGITY